MIQVRLAQAFTAPIREEKRIQVPFGKAHSFFDAGFIFFFRFLSRARHVLFFVLFFPLANSLLKISSYPKN